MRDAFVLLHSGQFFGFVTRKAVRHQGPAVVAWNDLPYLLTAMLPPDLINRLLAGVEGHQVGSLTAHSPTRVVGIGHGRLTYPLAQLPIGGPDGTLGLFERVLRDGALGDRDPGHFLQN